MWATAYLALFGFAVLATVLFTVSERAIPFWSAVATALWAFLALTGGEVEIVTNDGTREMIEIGAAQLLFAGLSLLSTAALLGSIMGYYPEDTVTAEDYQPR